MIDVKVGRAPFETPDFERRTDYFTEIARLGTARREDGADAILRSADV
jgi:hypothetical protein